MGLFTAARKKYRNLPNNPVDTRITILEKLGECGSAFLRALASYQSLSADLGATLLIMARELDKFYDKKCRYKETIVELTTKFKGAGEAHKEKVGLADFQADRLKEIWTAANAAEGPFIMLRTLTEALLDDRDEYIHYSEKLEELKSGKIKKENSGVKAGKADIEKIERV